MGTIVFPLSHDCVVFITESERKRNISNRSDVPFCRVRFLCHFHDGNKSRTPSWTQGLTVTVKLFDNFYKTIIIIVVYDLTGTIHMTGTALTAAAAAAAS